MPHLLNMNVFVQVWILWVCASLLLMRGICGVLSDYQGTEHIYMCASGSLGWQRINLHAETICHRADCSP